MFWSTLLSLQNLVRVNMTPLALEKNSNGGIKRKSGILLFNHEKHICNTRLPMATKLGKLVTYVKKFPAIKSYDPVITL